MQLSTNEISKIKSKLFAKIADEFDRAVNSDELDEFLEKYDIVFEPEAIPVDTRRMKILVFGQRAGKVVDYYKAAETFGISRANLEFVSTYEDAKKYNIAKLENSFEFSDIIAGPMPHMIKGVEDNSSFIAKVKNHPENYPRLTVAYANGEIKLSITSFKKALLKTRYRDALL